MHVAHALLAAYYCIPLSVQSSPPHFLHTPTTLSSLLPFAQAVLYAFENFARRMVHSFPTNPTSQVCLGLMLRRRGHDGSRPVPQALRRAIEALLRRAMEDDGGSDCGTGWKALAELQYENRHYQEAYDTGGCGALGR